MARRVVSYFNNEDAMMFALKSFPDVSSEVLFVRRYIHLRLCHSNDLLVFMFLAVQICFRNIEHNLFPGTRACASTKLEGVGSGRAGAAPAQGVQCKERLFAGRRCFTSARRSRHVETSEQRISSTTTSIRLCGAARPL